ncbi:uncharacterized protein LACBIDRAFT_314345 [Laccaria bicolor S238N-H82]|uniref:Predicted protein n=1 Tax=Laccaria bicolor (strain S238N-H82 / ATCC MYA-4686) TaxID=486041 RepID=B0DYC2_LACBS|nr:uncharacterized protein LACBIDRAFT_314345 [Laccaria bicolor S238N-H82]EDR00362.1 predicted protein [Laccaria bicolor S238N-H82]|eukprot:XP_001888921.1 predicted protein [Laccaria bicolor S238N-H82]
MLIQDNIGYACGGVGHCSRDCFQGFKCYNCSGVGHISRDCPHDRSGLVILAGQNATSPVTALPVGQRPSDCKDVP